MYNTEPPSSNLIHTLTCSFRPLWSRFIPLLLLILNNEPVERVMSETESHRKQRLTHILSEVIVALFFSSSSERETNSCAEHFPKRRTLKRPTKVAFLCRLLT